MSPDAVVIAAAILIGLMLAAYIVGTALRCCWAAAQAYDGHVAKAASALQQIAVVIQADSEPQCAPRRLMVGLAPDSLAALKALAPARKEYFSPAMTGAGYAPIVGTDYPISGVTTPAVTVTPAKPRKRAGRAK